MMPEEVTFRSEDACCAGLWYTPSGSERHPVVIMAHGMGLTRELGLRPFAERFCAAGMCVLLFDYRHYGASAGTPRELLSIARQRADYRAAVQFAQQHPRADATRIALWGYSFSGGHVMALSAERLAIRAVVAMAPFSSGRYESRRTPPRRSWQLARDGLRDLWANARGQQPVYIPLIGADSTGALMAGAEHERGYRSIVPPEVERAERWRNRVAARIALAIPWYEPSRRLRDAKVPVLMAVGLRDSLAPAAPALDAAEYAERVTVRKYDCGHFDFFHPPIFEQTMADQLAFLSEQLVLPKERGEDDAGDERVLNAP